MSSNFVNLLNLAFILVGLSINLGIYLSIYLFSSLATDSYISLAFRILVNFPIGFCCRRNQQFSGASGFISSLVDLSISLHIFPSFSLSLAADRFIFMTLPHTSEISQKDPRFIVVETSNFPIFVWSYLYPSRSI